MNIWIIERSLRRLRICAILHLKKSISEKNTFILAKIVLISQKNETMNTPFLRAVRTPFLCNSVFSMVVDGIDCERLLPIFSASLNLPYPAELDGRKPGDWSLLRITLHILDLLASDKL